MLIRFPFSLPCPVTIETFFFPGAHLIPGMDTLFPADQITAEPAAVAKAFQDNAAILTADAVVVADSFGVVTKLHR